MFSRVRGRKAPPASPSGDELIRDYLTRVTHASLRLPKGARMAFVSRTQARVERECGPDVMADPGKVLEVLAALGEPEDLVRAERARIDAAWIKRRAGSEEAGEAAAAAITAPLEPRPITSRWRPATDSTQPLPSAIAGTPDGQVTDPPAGRGSQEPPDLPPADPELTLAATARLARGHLLETVSIVLLAVGGLVFPIAPPGWLLGSLLALTSRLWDLRDKVIALFGPLLVTAVVSGMVAVVNRVPGNFVVIYVHAFADGAGYLLRFGCLASACYLAWRVHRGRRVKVPPWQRPPARPRGR